MRDDKVARARATFPLLLAVVGLLVIAGLGSSVSAAERRGAIAPRTVADGANGSFSSLHGPGDNVTSLAFADDTLYAGSFSWATGPTRDDSFIGGWSGSAWRQVGGGLAGTGGSNWVAALATIDDTLFAAGPFRGAIGVAGTRNIGAFANGAWHSMKSIDETTTDGTISALAASDDTLYAAGQFTVVGGVAASNIAQWADDTWRPLGSGLSIGTNPVLAAGANTLYVAGSFVAAGGVANTGKIATWSDDTFHALGSGVDDTTAFASLAVQDDTLYAGGTLYLPGSSPSVMRHVAAWSHGAWHPLGAGLSWPANSLAVDDTHGLVYAGGPFPNPRTADDTFIAQVWDQGSDEWIPLDDSSSTSPFSFYNGTITSAIAVDDSVVYLGAGGMEWRAWPNGRVFRWTWEPPTAALSVTSGLVNSSVPITGWSLIGVDSVTFGSTPAAITRDDSTSLTATVPASLAPGSYAVTVSAVGGTTQAGTFTVLPTPNPPHPQAPSAPREVTAVAGNASATVSWTAPESEGSYPISTYSVTSTPGGKTCLVTAPTVTCEVTGLTNATSYTFTAAALNGSGWSVESAPSNAVTPRAPVVPSIVISGARGQVRGKPGIIVTGSTRGMGMGAILRPWIRFPGEAGYSEGVADILVSMRGDFTWQRTTGKKVYVFVKTQDGLVMSNRITIPAA